MSFNKKSSPMTKDQFHKWLKNWYNNSTEKTISDYGNHGQPAYLHIKDGGNLFHLNADTQRIGVEAYLKLLDTENDLLWSVVLNKNMKMNKIAFGENKKIIKGFYLYIFD
mgnify:CR=1 FL=1